MKKILAAFLLFAFSTACFAQEPVPAKTKTKEELLKKSKNQRTAAYIMGGVGAVAFSAGFITLVEGLDSESKTNNGVGLMIAGEVVAVGGLVMYIVSGKTKKKANAMTASFKMEKGLPYAQRGMGATYYPALSIKLPIK